jgi:hypothetical protein
MFCTNCGERIPDESEFCPHCGAKVTHPSAEAPDETRVMRPGSQHPVPAPPQQPYLGGQDPDVTVMRKAMPQQAPAAPAKPPSQHRSLVVGILIGVVCGIAALLALMFALRLGPFDATEAQDEETTAATTAVTDEAGQDDEADDAAATTEPATTEEADDAEATDSEDYVLPDSSTRLYSADELEGYTDWELYIARNEIYARHGRRFKNGDLQAYFDSKSWYSGTIDAEDFSDDMLSETERQNVLTIRSVEESRGSEYLG